MIAVLRSLPWLLCFIVGCSIIGCNRARAADPDVRAVDKWWADRDWTAKERTDGAKERRLSTVKSLFAKANVQWPPTHLLFRAYKAQELLEVWAGKTKALTKIASYEICAASGDLGPKRKEGDRQVPEGFYRLTWFNPASKFHLSMLVDYPNRADRVHADKKEPGGEIMIHGDCRSRGCLAMSDGRIEELWLMAKAAKTKPHAHIFPTRDWKSLSDKRHSAFWANLKKGHDLFDKTKALPTVTVDSAGFYRF